MARYINAMKEKKASGDASKSKLEKYLKEVGAKLVLRSSVSIGGVD